MTLLAQILAWDSRCTTARVLTLILNMFPQPFREALSLGTALSAKTLCQFFQQRICVIFCVKQLYIFSLHSCTKNCQAKMISDEKTILQSNCEAYCTGKLRFSWSLYIFDNINSPEPLNLSSLHEIPQEEFQNMVYNPINELSLAIKPNALQCDKKYILAFQAIRPSAVLGEQRSTLLVNSPPTGGKLYFLQITIYLSIHYPSIITCFVHLALYSLMIPHFIHLSIHLILSLSIDPFIAGTTTMSQCDECNCATNAPLFS